MILDILLYFIQNLWIAFANGTYSAYKVWV